MIILSNVWIIKCKQVGTIGFFYIWCKILSDFVTNLAVVCKYGIVAIKFYAFFLVLNMNGLWRFSELYLIGSECRIHLILKTFFFFTKRIFKLNKSRGKHSIFSNLRTDSDLFCVKDSKP